MARLRQGGAGFGHWTLDIGHWTLDIGLWTLDIGLWTLDFGHWTLDFGHWTLDFGHWTLDFGHWTLDFGHWTLDFGHWTLDFGLWTLDFGLLSIHRLLEPTPPALPAARTRKSAAPGQSGSGRAWPRRVSPAGPARTPWLKRSASRAGMAEPNPTAQTAPRRARCR